MSEHSSQVRVAQQLSATIPSRRRSMPPSLRASVSQSLDQRWRERPHLRALHLTPAEPDGVVHAIVGRSRVDVCVPGFVQENRAVRVQVCGARFHRRSVPMPPAETGSRPSEFLQQNPRDSYGHIERHHHRVVDDGAVLSVVNALRFASTRPQAGPSGIDNTCARHCWAIARWWSI